MMVEVLATYLSDLIAAQNDPRSQTAVDPVTMPPNSSFPSFEYFCAEREPGISLRKYVDRLANYMRCTPECFIYALAYIRRMVDSGFPLHARSVHRTILTALVVAAKTRDDHYYSMTYYAQVGGVAGADLNSMELRFLLDAIEFRAEVSVQEYRLIVSDVNQSLLAAQQRHSVLLGGDSATARVMKPAVSGASLVSDTDNGSPGLSGMCSTVSSPPEVRHVSPSPLDRRMCGGLVLGRAQHTTNAHMHPLPQWITECRLYW